MSYASSLAPSRESFPPKGFLSLQADAPVAGARAAEAAFAAYDRFRRRRIEAQLGPRAEEALRLLPLLLHLNRPGLPGYVDDPQCPVGVSGYSPHREEIRLARRHFPGADPRPAGVLRPAVELVAVMGSAGTIGFSGESDLDVWVCHGPAVSGWGLELFRRKVAAVEAWMNRHCRLEVHLFLQATQSVCRNDFGEAGPEGCGSAMGALLKEEFYRTGVPLAGKAPFWRLVPPGVGPEEYRRHCDLLRQSSAFDAGGYVDLGCVERVPPGELFGAVVWQIVKGWKSPFKSALKLGLLERGARSGPEGRPLCERLKERVLAGERVDPYRLLFDEVLAHYRVHGEAAAEDLLARCFYLKTGVRLDPSLRFTPTLLSLGSDEAVLREYVASWGWDERRLRCLNAFETWRLEWVAGLAREVDRYFLRTYQRIREALGTGEETPRITPRDLDVLGRKLRAVYGREQDKVEVLHLVGGGVEEPCVSLHQERLPDGEVPWRLFRGRVASPTVGGAERELLRSSDDPLELLVWAVWNRLVGTRTRVFCRGLAGGVPAADLEALIRRLTELVERTRVSEPSHEALSADPVPDRLLIVPSLWGEGGGSEEVRAVFSNSWGETFCRRWHGPDALQALAEEVLVPFLLRSPDPTSLQVFAPLHKVGVLRGSPRRLQRELAAAAGLLGGRRFPEGLRRRLVGMSATGAYVLDRSGPGELRCRTFPSREGLLRFLCGVGPHTRVETRVESSDPELAPLKAAFAASCAGLIDVFLWEEGGRETILVVDEVGHLSRVAGPAEPFPYRLARLLLFLEGTVADVGGQHGSPLRGKSLRQVLRIHSLLREGKWHARTATREHLSRVRALGLLPEGLVIERGTGKGEGEEAGYRITWGDQSIRSGEVGDPVAETRRRIREARLSGGGDEPFVTRVFLDAGFAREHCGAFVTTGHYLFYKQAVEQRLGG
ncbi:MAG: class I adenylate cyclase [Deferrisomatales bacterium]